MIPKVEPLGIVEFLEPRPENIPERLEGLEQWVNWARIWDEDKEKFSKPPMTALGCNASSTNENTWTTLKNSLAVLGRAGVYVDNNRKRHRVTLDGVGVAGLEKTPYTGVDLDHCIDPETGEISPDAWKIVEALDSYTEITPSVKGLRIWVEAEKRLGWSANTGGEISIEVYTQGRFFTVTGWHLEGTPRTVEKRQPALDAFMERHAPPRPLQSWMRLGNRKREYTGSEDYRFDLEGFLEEFGVVVLREVRDNTSERTYYIVCPWAHEHTGGDTSGTRVGQYPSGAPWFHCNHAHCIDSRKWREFREYLDPGCYTPWWVKVVAKSG